MNSPVKEKTPYYTATLLLILAPCQIHADEQTASRNISASVPVQYFYDSNIYSSKKNPESDMVTDIKPRLTIKSSKNKYKMELTSEAHAGFFNNIHQENYIDYSSEITGTFTPGRDSSIKGRITNGKYHIPRSSTDNEDSNTPLTFTKSLIDLGYTLAARKFTLAISAYKSQYDHRNNTYLSSTINNDDRDRSTTSSFMLINYNLNNTNHSLFIEESINDTEYLLPADASGHNRDSSSRTSKLGFSYKSRKTSAIDIFLVSHKRTSRDTSLPSFHTTSWGGNLIWPASRTSRISARQTSNLNETTFPGASGLHIMSREIKYHKRLTQKSSLTLETSESLYKYTGTTRTDTLSGNLVKFTHRLNKRTNISLSISKIYRDSENTAETYDFTKELYLFSAEIFI